MRRLSETQVSLEREGKGVVEPRKSAGDENVGGTLLKLRGKSECCGGGKKKCVMKAGETRMSKEVRVRWRGGNKV